jgi:hypothetical protein
MDMLRWHPVAARSSPNQSALAAKPYSEAADWTASAEELA